MIPKTGRSKAGNGQKEISEIHHRTLTQLKLKQDK
jgi:hypothetical protein